MEVNFTLDDFGNEAESLQAAAAGRVPEESEYLWGAFVLSHAGQPTLTLSDDLFALAAPLCGPVVQRLHQGQAANLTMAGWPGDYDFTPAPGGQVRITGTGGADATYPQLALAEALQACGRRLAACMTEFADLSPACGPAAQALVKAIDQAAATAPR